jgi:aminoglycoside phosphotransferase (APT) family kinase protein
MPPATFDAYAYAREVLLPSLGLQHHPFVVQNPESEGTASRLVKVVVERGPILLVRSFQGRARASRNAAALKVLEWNELPAPRLKLDDTGAANLLLRRSGLPRWATAETWIEGMAAVETKEPEKVALMVASVLARYHSVTRGRWGRPGFLPDPRPYHRHTLSVAGRLIRDLEGRGILTSAAADAARGRYQIWQRNLMKLGTFHLIHRDANRRNFIVPSDKKIKGVIPVDLQRLSFGPCSEDLADALHHFCRSDRALAGKFLQRHLDDAAPSCRATWARTGEFFIALNALKRLHKRTDPKAINRLQGGDPRISQWRDVAISLSGPPPVWPEPGSAPPEHEALLGRLPVS